MPTQGRSPFADTFTMPTDTLLAILPPFLAPFVTILPPVPAIDPRPLYGPAMFVGSEYGA